MRLLLVRNAGLAEREHNEVTMHDRIVTATPATPLPRPSGPGMLAEAKNSPASGKTPGR